VIEASDIFYVLSNDERSLVNDRFAEFGSARRRTRADGANAHPQIEKEEERVRKKYELPSVFKTLWRVA
jgi:hypothetical protein